MDRPYWDAEKPLVIQTGRNCLRFYGKAERLQVGFAPYVNRRGEERMVKACTAPLNLDTNRALLRQHPPLRPGGFATGPRTRRGSGTRARSGCA